MRIQYYTDPVHGYIFRSKKDVIRYLQTGETSKHTIKPKSMCTNDLKLTDDEIAVSAIFLFPVSLVFSLTSNLVFSNDITSKNVFSTGFLVVSRDVTTSKASWAVAQGRFLS